jgi:Rap1a immunity proteins
MIAVMAVGTEARADRFVDGNRLYELCRPNSRNSSFCGDFVMSVANALMVGRVGHWTACIPNGVTDDQVVDVATRYLDAHPAERPHAARELVAQALAEVFPCRQ